MSSETMRNWAVVTGLIREPLEALLILSHLVELRSQGLLEGIVISTWYGEIDRYEGLREKINNLGIILVESETIPQHEDKGNFLVQQKTMINGIHVVPKGSFVLKARFDRYISKLYSDFLMKILNGNFDLNIGELNNLPQIFNKKMIIINWHRLYPFCFTDTFFSG